MQKQIHSHTVRGFQWGRLVPFQKIGMEHFYVYMKKERKRGERRERKEEEREREEGREGEQEERR
jgi:hypothetical protein